MMCPCVREEEESTLQCASLENTSSPKDESPSNMRRTDNGNSHIHREGKREEESYYF